MKHLALGLALAIAAGSADAAVFRWSADLAPENEVPPVIAPGATGTGSGRLDTESGLLTWDISWSGLTGAATAAHFHGPATTAANAGVVLDIGGISGLISPSSGSASISDLDVADVLDELWYINVHTQANPGGEIRGQVIPSAAPIPLPASLPLLLILALAWGIVGRLRA